MEEELKNHLSKGRLRKAKAVGEGSAEETKEASMTPAEPKGEDSPPEKPEGAPHVFDFFGLGWKVNHL